MPKGKKISTGLVPQIPMTQEEEEKLEQERLKQLQESKEREERAKSTLVKPLPRLTVTDPPDVISRKKKEKIRLHHSFSN